MQGCVLTASGCAHRWCVDSDPDSGVLSVCLGGGVPSLGVKLCFKVLCCAASCCVTACCVLPCCDIVCCAVLCCAVLCRTLQASKVHIALQYRPVLEDGSVVLRQGTPSTKYNEVRQHTPLF
jgi:hypothetical protein